MSLSRARLRRTCYCSVAAAADVVVAPTVAAAALLLADAAAAAAGCCAGVWWMLCGRARSTLLLKRWCYHGTVARRRRRRHCHFHYNVSRSQSVHMNITLKSPPLHKIHTPQTHTDTQHIIHKISIDSHGNIHHMCRHKRNILRADIPLGLNPFRLDHKSYFAERTI